METRDYLNAILLNAQAALDSLGPPVFAVKAGDSLQNAIDKAPSGAVISVDPVFFDGIILRADKSLTLKTTGTLPVGGRVNPSLSDSLFKLRSNVNGSAIVAPSGAKGYTLQGFQCLPGTDPSIAMVACGDPMESDPAKAASNIVFDQSLLIADPLRGGKRGFALNCGQVSVLDSHVEGFWFKDDSQAVAGWNGPGPFNIDNCYLEASGEVVIFGGADPRNEAMQPTNLRLVDSTLSANLAWRTNRGATRKNAFELKNMIGAFVDNCVFENSWASGQAGALILITPRNQSGTAPYSTVRDVLIQNSTLRNAGAGFQVQGDDDEHNSAKASNIVFKNLKLEGIDAKVWNNAITGERASGRIIQVARSPQGVVFDNITADGANLNSWITLDGPGLSGLSISNSSFPEGKYGMVGGNPSVFGAPAWNAFVQGTLTNVTIKRTGVPGATLKYPTGVTVIS
jgi:hypothetical protein